MQVKSKCNTDEHQHSYVNIYVKCLSESIEEVSLVRRKVIAVSMDIKLESDKTT